MREPWLSKLLSASRESPARIGASFRLTYPHLVREGGEFTGLTASGAARFLVLRDEGERGLYLARVG